MEELLCPPCIIDQKTTPDDDRLKDYNLKKQESQEKVLEVPENLTMIKIENTSGKATVKTENEEAVNLKVTTRPENISSESKDGIKVSQIFIH